MKGNNIKGNVIVYGGGPDYCRLLFIPKDAALELAGLNHALLHAETWGDMKRAVSAERQQQIRERSESLIEEMGEPNDDTAFDVEWIFGYTDGDWPEWPAQEMLSWVPEEIKAEFGRVKDSTFNGPFLELDHTREAEIVKAFQEHGCQLAQAGLCGDLGSVAPPGPQDLGSRSPFRNRRSPAQIRRRVTERWFSREAGAPLCQRGEINVGG